VLTVSQPQAANYLDIEPLLNLVSRTIANLLKGKSTEDMREYLNLENDFPVEEQERIRLENGWADLAPFCRDQI
jgi:S-phase kinase-associated protein 1